MAPTGGLAAGGCRSRRHCALVCRSEIHSPVQRQHRLSRSTITLLSRDHNSQAAASTSSWTIARRRFPENSCSQKPGAEREHSRGRLLPAVAGTLVPHVWDHRLCFRLLRIPTGCQAGWRWRLGRGHHHPGVCRGHDHYAAIARGDQLLVRPVLFGAGKLRSVPYLLRVGHRGLRPRGGEIARPLPRLGRRTAPWAGRQGWGTRMRRSRMVH